MKTIKLAAIAAMLYISPIIVHAEVDPSLYSSEATTQNVRYYSPLAVKLHRLRLLSDQYYEEEANKKSTADDSAYVIYDRRVLEQSQRQLLIMKYEQEVPRKMQIPYSEPNLSIKMKKKANEEYKANAKKRAAEQQKRYEAQQNHRKLRKEAMERKNKELMEKWHQEDVKRIAKEKLEHDRKEATEAKSDKEYWSKFEEEQRIKKLKVQERFKKQQEQMHEYIRHGIKY